MTKLIDIHGELSRLVFAVQQNLEPLPVEVRAEWQNGTYLSVAVECKGKHVQTVSDRLVHGVLQGEFDYRFRSIARPTGIGPDAWTTVRAYPDLQHDRSARQ
jgi:hypothetical protein